MEQGERRREARKAGVKMKRRQWRVIRNQERQGSVAAKLHDDDGAGARLDRHGGAFVISEIRYFSPGVIGP